MSQIILGALAMAFALAGLFFLRFWKDSRDRLFALFGVAFVVLAVNRVGLAIQDARGEQGDYLYWVRFLAFGLILVAILDKNRSRNAAHRSAGSVDQKSVTMS